MTRQRASEAAAAKAKALQAKALQAPAALAAAAIACVAFAVLSVAGARAQSPAPRSATAATAATPSQAGRLEAKYEASLAGIPVGKGQWAIDITDEQFSAAASGGTAGLLKAFAGGSGFGQSQGRVVAGALVPTNYSATTSSAKKSETIKMALAAGAVKDFSIEPEPPADPERIVVTEAHRRNVIDPMTGSLLRVAGSGEVMAPDSCRTGTAIFDGRMRYDIKLDYKRMEVVKAEKGYYGPAIVCAVYFTPIAGYVPDRAAIKYLAAQRGMEAWLVPIAGTRVLVPYRVTIPTPLGQAMLEATEFVTTAAAPKTAAKTN